jgi:SAM-dependent methyltransferase
VSDAPATPDPRRQAVWTRYWATGAAHSCAGSFGDVYGGRIAAFWQRVHANTPPLARVLDIASGSAALPRLLQQLRPDLAMQVDAIDLSTAAPSALPGMTFHGGVSAEALPFPDDSFDLVVSQYGLEYADASRAVPELLRVRKPDGRVALVLHHAASRPVTLAAVELAHLDWLLAADGLLAAAADILGPMARAATPEGRAALATDAAANAARHRFNAAQAALKERAMQPDGADVLMEARHAVAELMVKAQQVGERPAADGLETLRGAMTDQRVRLQELRACARDAAQVEALSATLQRAGLAVAMDTVHEAGHLMAWSLLAQPR